MNHDEQIERISLLMDDALPPSEQPGLFTHLAECEECRQAYARMHRLSRSVRHLPEVDVPSALDAKFRILAMGTPPRAVTVPSVMLSFGAVVMMFLFIYLFGSAQEARMMSQYRESVPSGIPVTVPSIR